MEVAAQTYMSLGATLEKYDVLICPTTALPAVRADFDPTKHEVRINGKKLKHAPVIAWCMTPPFNMLSRCPVLSVPTGRARNGVPTGMQIVGRTYSDADVFRAGMAYETAVGGWYKDRAARPPL
jgi:Asp-tRNA(Asn)/Glu-tRNA(Gln) amidotransferase A subunit family amidase